MSTSLRSSILLAILLLTQLGSNPCSAKSEEYYISALSKLIKKQPSADPKPLARDLLKKNSADPEAHIAIANWFYNLGEDVIFMPENLPAGLFVPEIRDTKEDREQGRVHLGTAGYMHGGKFLDSTGRQEAVKILENARTLFPQRLDIALGVQEIFDSLGDTTGQIDAIEKFISATKTHAADLWLNGSKRLPGKPEDFVKHVIMEILNAKVELATTRDADVLVALSRIFVRELPASFEAWNFLSISCDIRNDAMGRYRCLRKARQLAPEDEIITRNWMQANFRLHLWSDTLEAAHSLLEKHPNTRYKQETEFFINAITEARQ